VSDVRYDPPAVEERTPVTEPLNTAPAQSEPRTLTPVWRKREDNS
jgi:hypothetical protein